MVKKKPKQKVDENGNVTLLIHIKPELKESLEAEKLKSGLSLATIVKLAIQDYLEKTQQRKKRYELAAR